MLKQMTRIAATVLASSAFLAGFAASAEPLKVGVMGPFSGPSARIGEEIQNGTRMAAEDARDAGELPVVVDGEKRDFEFVWVDSESSPEKAVKAFQDAISRQGVEIMLNGWHGSVGLAMIDIIATYDMIHFGHLAAPEDISQKIVENNYSHWFKGWPAPKTMSGLYVTAVQDFIEEAQWTPENTRAAVVVEDTDWGRTWGEAIVKSLEDNGWKVIAEDVVKADETKHQALLTKYKAGDVSLVAFTLNAPAAAAAFVKQHYNAGLDGLLLADGLGWFSNWYEMTGAASDYTLSMDSPRAITSEQKEWSKRYEEKFGYAPAAASGGHAYDYARMLIRGMNKAGTLEKKTLSDALLNTEQEGVWHFYSFAKEAGDGAIAPYEVKVGKFMEGFAFPMVQHYDGDAYVVWPPSHAEGEFRAPNE